MSPLTQVDFFSVFHAVPDPYLVLDRDLRVVAANRAYLEATLTVREQIVGRGIFQVFPDNPKEPHPEAIGKLSESLQRVLREKQPDVMGVQKYKVRLPTPEDGFQERYWIATNIPIFDSNQEVAYILSCLQDVTELEQLREQQGQKHEEEQRLASYPMLNPNPVVELDLEGNVLYCNPAAEAVLKESGCRHYPNPFLPPDLPALLQQLRRGDRLFREVEVKGTRFEETILLIPERNAIRIYTMDVSRRREAEREREEDLLKLESVLESITEGVVIADLSGNIVMMNQEALRLHDFQNVEQARQHILDYQNSFELWDLSGRLLPEDEWPLERVFRGERFVDQELQLKNKKNGNTVICSYSGTPVRHKGRDEIILAVLTTRDVTEAKRVEAELGFATAQLQMITTNMPVGVTRCSAERRYLWVSPEYSAWMGKGPEEIAGRQMAEVVGEEAYRTLTPHIERVLGGQRANFEVRVNYRGLGERWIMGTYTPTFDPEGRVDGWIGVIFDITERKGLEEQVTQLNADLAARIAELEGVNRDQAAFNHMVSHDLRRPLNTISTACEALSMICGDRLDDECKEFVGIANKSVFAMDRLIDALLQFARSTQEELQRESVDLSEMAQSILNELSAGEPERRARCTVAPGVVVSADPSLLRSVLENLIGNAWKFTAQREETVIEVGTVEQEGKPAYFVRDNGSGFDMADADKLFVPFKRLPGAKTVSGFGIGLATVERIVRRHGGRVWAEGEPGRGATFYFTLGEPAAG